MTTIATPEEIAGFKARYGEENIHLVTVEGGHDFIIRKPGRRELDIIGEKGMNKDISGANSVLIKNCVIAGDTSVFDKDGSVYMAVMEQLKTLTGHKKAELKKL